MLLAAAPAAFGGLETVLTSLAGGLRADGVDIHVALTVEREPPDALVSALRAVGIEPQIICASSRGYLAEARALRRVLDSLWHPVVHTHGFRSDLVGGWVARSVRRPWVSTAHGFTSETARLRVYEALQRRAWRGAAAVIAVSAPLQTQLIGSGLPCARVPLVRNAVAASAVLDSDAARQALGQPAGGPLLGWVGRLSPEKSPELALAVLQRIGDPSVQLVFVGDGPLRRALEREATERGLAGRVAFTGPVPQAGRLLRGFDLLLLTSRTEGTPMVLLEAAMAGVPIVATDVGGVGAVTGPSGAHLAPSGDAEALAQGVRTLLDQPAVAAAQCAAAKRHVHLEFGFERWIAAHRAIYRAAAGLVA